MKHIYSFVIFAILHVNAALATNYHVDAQHQGEQTGTAEKPFTTLQQAASKMVAGDTCFIHEGVYREVLNPVNSGTQANPIVYMAYNNEKVIISAADKVTGWQAHQGNIYKVGSVNLNLDKRNNVFFEAQKMQLARWPNNVDNNEYTLDAKYIDKTADSYSNSYISNNEIPVFDWTGGVIHYLGAHSGCSWQRTITAFDAATKRVHFDTLPDKWPFSTHSPERYENGHRGIFYLMNKLEALDAPREWYYDEATKTLYFYAPDGQNPEGKYVEVSARQNTADISKNYIHLHKLNFFGGRVWLRGNHNQITDCRVKYAAEKIVTDITSASDSEAAIQFQNADFNTVRNCVLEEGTVNGLFLNNQSTDNLIENCVIKNFNKVGLHVCLIRSTGARNRFLYNTMSGSQRDGVYLTGNDSEFGYNHVSSCLLSGADGGLFYVTGQSQPKNIEVHHSWFNDAYATEHAGKKATGIYLDNNSAGYIVHHNVVWDVEWGGLHFNWNAIENEIYNNTFWNVGNADQATIQCWVPMQNGERTNVENNVLYNNLSDKRTWWDSGDGNFRVDGDEVLDNDFQYNLQVDNDIFEDFEARNFMPKAETAGIDNGTQVAGITDGFAGSAPDVGAYERDGEYWVPGAKNVAAELVWMLPADLVAPSLTFDDADAYTTHDFYLNQAMQIAVRYEAGTNQVVADDGAGITVSLQELQADGQLVREVLVQDASAAGLRAGTATASLSLDGLLASDELPAGNYYALVATFTTSGGEELRQTISPIQLKKPVITSAKTTWLHAVNVYPNPAETQVVVQTQGDIEGAVLGLFNASGKRLEQSMLTSNRQVLAVDKLAAGVYYLKITNKQQSTTLKFIKR